MSSCLVLQQEDRAFIGADSVICAVANGESVRTEYEDDKLFIVGKDIMFCAGNMMVVHELVDWCKSKYSETYIDIDELSKKLKCEYPVLKSEFSDAEVVISTFRDGKSIVYGLSQYNDYEPIIYKGDPRGVMIVTGGIRTKEVYEYAANAISNKITVVDIYNSIHSGSPYTEIGGQPTLIEHRNNSLSYLLKPKKLNRIIKESSVYNYISADIVYGKMFFGQSLTIQNANNTLSMDENGFKASATNGFSVQINPDAPDNIFTISENSTKLMYIDAVNRKLVFQGRIEAIDGHIGGWTIGTSTLTSGGVGMSSTTATNGVSFWAGNATPTSAPFRVLNGGKLYSTDAEITGTITATAGKIGGWSISGNNLVGTSASYIMGGRINIGDGFFGVTESSIYLGDFYMTYTDRALFMSTDQYSGMSASTAVNRFALWGGFNGGSSTAIGNYVFAVSGEMVYAQELTITGDSWWQNWTLSRTMKWLSDRITALGG